VYVSHAVRTWTLTTVTSLSAFFADIGHGDVEARPIGVLVNGRGRERVLVPADERRADNGVGADLDDRDVGNTVVRSTDSEKKYC
jgi:hypothetical protein